MLQNALVIFAYFFLSTPNYSHPSLTNKEILCRNKNFPLNKSYFFLGKKQKSEEQKLG
jgi:hypothetical protein